MKHLSAPYIYCRKGGIPHVNSPSTFPGSYGSDLCQPCWGQWKSSPWPLLMWIVEMGCIEMAHPVLPKQEPCRSVYREFLLAFMYQMQFVCCYQKYSNTEKNVSVYVCKDTAQHFSGVLVEYKLAVFTFSISDIHVIKSREQKISSLKPTVALRTGEQTLCYKYQI